MPVMLPHMNVHPFRLMSSFTAADCESAFFTILLAYVAARVIITRVNLEGMCVAPFDLLIPFYFRLLLLLLFYQHLF